jgi:rhomboid protease GluP
MNWKDFFDRLGLNGTWWQWRILRWQENWRSRIAAVEDGRRVAAYPHKFCSACRALMDRDAKVCPRCGARAPGWLADSLRRTLGLVLPRWCPASTILLFLNLLNMAVLLAVFGVGNLLRPESRALFLMGALDPALFFAGEYWRLVTYGFLHIGLLHIVFNLMALSQVGPVLETEVGSARFYVVYTLCLIGGGVADLIVRGPVSMLIAGASGALFGLIGFGMSFAHFYGGAAGRQQRNFFLHWAVYGFLFGLVVGADNVCHAGGFAVGAVAGFLVERERARHDALTPLWRGLAVLCALATVAAFGWMIIAQRA